MKHRYKKGYTKRVQKIFTIGVIFINDIKKPQDMNPFSLDAKADLMPYYNIVRYEACEYSFTTMYLWQQSYEFHYTIKPKFALIFGSDDKKPFILNPLCEEKYYEEAMEFAAEVFEFIKCPLYFRAITSPFKEYLEQKYPNKLEMIEHRDGFDYVYEAEKLRTLSGRKLHGKKNHYNAFIKEYKDRAEYRKLTPENHKDIIDVEEKWAHSKENDENIVSERLAISKLLSNISRFPEIKIGGIYIDGKLSAFAIGDLLNSDTALVHVEKADDDIRGLYVAINKWFIENEFPNVTFVNREDDLGLEGLRNAKLSYKPVKLVKKWEILSKG